MFWLIGGGVEHQLQIKSTQRRFLTVYSVLLCSGSGSGSYLAMTLHQHNAADDEGVHVGERVQQLSRAERARRTILCLQNSRHTPVGALWDFILTSFYLELPSCS